MPSSRENCKFGVYDLVKSIGHSMQPAREYFVLIVYSSCCMTELGMHVYIYIYVYASLGH